MIPIFFLYWLFVLSFLYFLIMVVIGTKNIKELTGKVLSTKMQATLVVEVSRAKTHPLYKKTFISKKKYYVHNVDEQVKE